eukprot:1161424-Pelagomonas_calceolata.AAC.2
MPNQAGLVIAMQIVSAGLWVLSSAHRLAPTQTSVRGKNDQSQKLRSLHAYHFQRSLVFCSLRHFQAKVKQESKGQRGLLMVGHARDRHTSVKVVKCTSFLDQVAPFEQLRHCGGKHQCHSATDVRALSASSSSSTEKKRTDQHARCGYVHEGYLAPEYLQRH